MKTRFLKSLVAFVCTSAFILGIFQLIDYFRLLGSEGSFSSSMVAGFKLSTQQAQQLEKDILTNPNDTEKRQKLLAYYFSHFELQPKRDKHILWLIQNQPEAQVLRETYGRIDQFGSKEASATAIKEWERQYQKQPNNPKIVDGYMLAIRDRLDPQIVTLCQKGSLLEPKNGYWHNEISEYYQRKLEETPLTAEVERQKMAKLALDYLEHALPMESSGHEGSALFELRQHSKKQVTLNIELKNYDRARQLINVVLNDAGGSLPKVMSGLKVFDLVDEDMKHICHILLGQIALRQKDVNTAKRELLEAGNVTGSPVLGSFGPNMLLAKELLDKGEKETVLQYFEKCRAFWNNAQLNKWVTEAKAGKTPDFGANLIYGM